jgi:hypothetical protein
MANKENSAASLWHYLEATAAFNINTVTYGAALLSTKY